MCFLAENNFLVGLTVVKNLMLISTMSDLNYFTVLTPSFRHCADCHFNHPINCMTNKHIRLIEILGIL